MISLQNVFCFILAQPFKESNDKFKKGFNFIAILLISFLEKYFFKMGKQLKVFGNPGHWGNPYICFYECVMTSHSCKSIIANYYGFYSFYSLLNFIILSYFSLSLECQNFNSAITLQIKPYIRYVFFFKSKQSSRTCLNSYKQT